jgi:hypothetical protein
MSGASTVRARRAQRILRAAARRPMSIAELEREVRRGEPAFREPGAQALKTRTAIRRLAEEGRLVATPAGWSADPAQGVVG